MSTESPVSLVPTKPEQELAIELKERLRASLAPVIVILDEARAAGFIPVFNLGVNELGRAVVADLHLQKRF